MAVIIETADGQHRAKADTLTEAWRLAWEVWERSHGPAGDWTGLREGPEVEVRYARKGE